MSEAISAPKTPTHLIIISLDGTRFSHRADTLAEYVEFTTGIIIARQEEGKSQQVTIGELKTAGKERSFRIDASCSVAEIRARVTEEIGLFWN